MKVTRAMVAKEAGVTPTTVSCVLNNTRYVSQGVRDRVMEVVERLHYIPDVNARAMLKKESMQIAILVDDIKNPFFLNVVDSIEKRVGALGFVTLISSEKNINRFVQSVLARRIDTVYICSLLKDAELKYIDWLIDENVTVITSPKIKSKNEKIIWIDFDMPQTIDNSIDYLMARGHKKIAYFTQYGKGDIIDDRQNAYVRRMEKEGLDVVIISPEQYRLPSVEMGRNHFSKLLCDRKDITAIICLNDILAIGVMDKAKEMGYELPKDLSVIGIDNIELGSLVTPRLTTYACDFNEFADRWVELAINKDKNKKEDCFFKLEFIERESVGEVE